MKGLNYMAMKKGEKGKGVAVVIGVGKPKSEETVIDMPEGYQVPDGVKAGETVEEVCEWTVNEDGTLSLKAFAGVPVSVSEAPEMEEEMEEEMPMEEAPMEETLGEKAGRMMGR